MLTNKEAQMFESVARAHPQLLDFLRAQLEHKYDVLVKMSDEAQLRRTQGYAQCLQDLVSNLTQHTGSPRQRAGSST